MASRSWVPGSRCSISNATFIPASGLLSSPSLEKRDLMTMKITRVEAIPLRLPDINERCDGSQETLAVKVHTDAGLVGIGEADSSALVAKAIIDAPLSHKICRGLAQCVVGENPF